MIGKQRFSSLLMPVAALGALAHPAMSVAQAGAKATPPAADEITVTVVHVRAALSIVVHSFAAGPAGARRTNAVMVDSQTGKISRDRSRL
jgi:hypothetical protein